MSVLEGLLKPHLGEDWSQLIVGHELQDLTCLVCLLFSFLFIYLFIYLFILK